MVGLIVVEGDVVTGTKVNKCVIDVGRKPVRSDKRHGTARKIDGTCRKRGRLLHLRLTKRQLVPFNYRCLTTPGQSDEVVRSRQNEINEVLPVVSRRSSVKEELLDVMKSYHFYLDKEHSVFSYRITGIFYDLFVITVR